MQARVSEQNDMRLFSRVFGMRFAIVILAMLLVLIAAIALGAKWTKEPQMFGDNVTLPDGRHVFCVRVSNSGVSCDWDRAE